MMTKSARETRRWRFVGACVEGQPFHVDGVDVWSRPWRQVADQTAEVKDPRYGQAFRFAVYEFEGRSGAVRMAAGECSAGVYLFYVAKPRWKFW